MTPVYVTIDDRVVTGWLHGKERQRAGQFVYVHILNKAEYTVRAIHGVWRHVPGIWQGNALQVCDGPRQLLAWGGCIDGVHLYLEPSSHPNARTRDGTPVRRFRARPSRHPVTAR